MSLSVKRSRLNRRVTPPGTTYFTDLPSDARHGLRTAVTSTCGPKDFTLLAFTYAPATSLNTNDMPSSSPSTNPEACQEPVSRACLNPPWLCQVPGATASLVVHVWASSSQHTRLFDHISELQVVHFFVAFHHFSRQRLIQARFIAAFEELPAAYTFAEAWLPRCWWWLMACILLILAPNER